MKSIVFCRVDWFSEYKGESFNSNYSKNGSNKQYERFNFASYDGYVYGYVRCSNIEKNGLNKKRINFKNNDDEVNDLTVIFFSRKNKNQKYFIVGWYENATALKEIMTREIYDSYGNKIENHYNLKVASNNAFLIPEKLRNIEIKINNLRSSWIWYTDTAERYEYAINILKQIDKYKEQNILNQEYFNNLYSPNGNVNQKKEFLMKEKEYYSKARIGQEYFRKILIDKWKKCQITNITNQELLFASHIKEFCECDCFEAYDIDNGLLLSPLFDRLFDRHLISFSQNGQIVYSQLIENLDYIKSQVINNKIHMNDNQKKYMMEHFKKLKK